MIVYYPTLIFRENFTIALRTRDNTLNGILELRLANQVEIATGSQASRFGHPSSRQR
jgi:hypothetical protein